MSLKKLVNTWKELKIRQGSRPSNTDYRSVHLNNMYMIRGFIVVVMFIFRLMRTQLSYWLDVTVDDRGLGS